MSYSRKIQVIGLSIVLIPFVSWADIPASTSEMSKDVWLAEVKGAVSAPVCKSFLEDTTIASQMKNHKISYDNCMMLIPPIVEQCEKKYSAELPATINDANADKWGQLIGECIGNEFAVKHLSN